MDDLTTLAAMHLDSPVIPRDPILAATLSECARQEQALHSYGQIYYCPASLDLKEAHYFGGFASAAHLYVHLTGCPHYQALFVTPDTRPHSLQTIEP